MNAKVLSTALEWLENLPPRTPLTRVEREQFALVLRPMPDPVAAKVIERATLECEFRPAPATLVRFAREITAEENPSLALPPAQATAYRDVRKDPLYQQIQADRAAQAERQKERDKARQARVVRAPSSGAAN